MAQVFQSSTLSYFLELPAIQIVLYFPQQFFFSVPCIILYVITVNLFVLNVIGYLRRVFFNNVQYLLSELLLFICILEIDICKHQIWFTESLQVVHCQYISAWFNNPYLHCKNGTTQIWNLSKLNVLFITHTASSCKLCL